MIKYLKESSIGIYYREKKLRANLLTVIDNFVTPLGYECTLKQRRKKIILTVFKSSHKGAVHGFKSCYLELDDTVDCLELKVLKCIQQLRA